MDRMLNMIVRMVMRQLLNRGINAGMNRAFGPKKGQDGQKPDPRAQETAKRAKQGARLANRMSKF